MIFLAAGPLFAFQTAAIFQKGVWQRFFKDRLADAFFLPTAGPLLDHSAVQFRQKGVWQPLFRTCLIWHSVFRSCTPFRSLSSPKFSKRGPRPPNLTHTSFLFVPEPVRILQKRVYQASLGTYATLLVSDKGSQRLHLLSLSLCTRAGSDTILSARKWPYDCQSAVLKVQGPLGSVGRPQGP